MAGSNAGAGGIYNQVNFNLYHYAGNNPIKYTDPTGEFFGFDDVFTGPVDELLVLASITLYGAIKIYNRDTGKRFSEALTESFNESLAKLKNLFVRKNKENTAEQTNAPEETTTDSDDKDTKPKSNPFKGKPGDSNTTYDSKGKPKQTRKYGDDGYPDTDIDYDHDHGQGQPHQHKWTRPEDGSPPTADNRQPGIPID